MAIAYTQHLRDMDDDESFDCVSMGICFYLDAAKNGYGFKAKNSPDYSPEKGFQIDVPDGLSAGAMRVFLSDQQVNNYCSVIVDELNTGNFNSLALSEAFSSLKVAIGSLVAKPENYAIVEKRNRPEAAFEYVLMHRPPEAAALPIGWKFRECSKTPFGVVAYSHPLPDDLVKQLQLVTAISPEAMVRNVINSIQPKYRDTYAEEADPALLKSHYQKSIRENNSICLNAGENEILQRVIFQLRRAAELDLSSPSP